MQVELKYQIGEKIKAGDRVYVVLGFEYIQGVSLKYVLLHQKDGAAAWAYMYEKEIEFLMEN